MQRKAVDFDFRTQNEPQKLIVDPDYEILKIQKMPPGLVWFWDDYPNYILIYGTLAEAEANKTAAERFKEDYLGRLSEIIKADTDVSQNDLKGKCVILFGQPETNKICQQFGDIFPIKFDHGKFTWQGITYDQPTQGVAQIVENPLEPGKKIVLYYGLSNDAAKLSWELYTMNTDASFVIFDGDKELLRGDWEEVDNNLYWNFNTQPSVQLMPDEQ
jgi:hypothetical protein